MANDNKELKNNVPCEEKQEARELTPNELAKVTGGVENGFRTSHEIHKIGLWDYEDLKDLSPCE